ncbi:MAG: DUF6600 domain-containing protein [Limisphaerales bacterium]
MKSPALSSYVWLIAIGATAVLLVGAFARFDPSASAKIDLPAGSDAFAAAAPEAAGEPALPANLSPGLAEIIRLAQAHVEEGVILSYIQNSGQVYTPSAEEILYLSDLGLPQNVIAALFKDRPAPPAPEAAPLASGVASRTPPGPDSASPATAAPDSNFFYNDLAPYGAWVEVPDYGLSWQPAVETIDADWCPYLDRGQWIDSDSGWYWLSDYTWGWAVFHYGRWIREPRFGWVWVPGKVWAPGWVAWRSTGDYYGWGPLPPGASVLGAASAVTASSFVFVPANHFLSRQLRGKVVPPARAASLFAKSQLLKNYSLVSDKIVHGGVSREEVAAATGKALKPVKLRSVSSPEAVSEVVDRSSLPVCRPNPSTAAAAAWSQSGALQGKSAAPKAATPAASQPEQVAVTDAEESSGLSENSLPEMQLPPLHYSPGIATPTPNRKFGSVVTPSSPVNPSGKSAPRPVHHAPSQHLDPVERPATPAPPAPQIEQNRTTYAAASRAVEAPPRPAPPPPAPQAPRASPSPPASATSSSHR